MARKRNMATRYAGPSKKLADNPGMTVLRAEVTTLPEMKQLADGRQFLKIACNHVSPVTGRSIERVIVNVWGNAAQTVMKCVTAGRVHNGMCDRRGVTIDFSGTPGRLPNGAPCFNANRFTYVCDRYLTGHLGYHIPDEPSYRFRRMSPFEPIGGSPRHTPVTPPRKETPLATQPDLLHPAASRPAAPTATSATAREPSQDQSQKSAQGLPQNRAQNQTQKALHPGQQRRMFDETLTITQALSKHQLADGRHVVAISGMRKADYDALAPEQRTNPSFSFRILLDERQLGIYGKLKAEPGEPIVLQATGHWERVPGKRSEPLAKDDRWQRFMFVPAEIKVPETPASKPPRGKRAKAELSL